MSRERSATLSAVMTGGALAVVALGSAAQVALYLGAFGTTHRTDGFIAAFAVYSLLVVVAQILRTTAVPLLSGANPAVTRLAFAWAMVAIAVLVTIVFEALAAPLGRLLARSSGAAGASVAEQSLRVMAPAAGLQLLAVGQAVRGALNGRLVRVGAAYMVSAIAGLIAFVPLRGVAAQSVLAWTTLTASVVLIAALGAALGVPRLGRKGVRAVTAAALAVARSTPVPASFVAMYPITLALAPRSAPGQVTLFGLAFTACSYLAGFTGQGLSMVDAVTLAQLGPGAGAERRSLVTRAFQVSLLAAAPAFGVAAVAGQTIIGVLVPSATGHAHASFSAELLLLAPWLAATIGLWAVLPAVLSDPHAASERWLLSVVAVLLVAHVSAALLGRAVGGFSGLTLAMALAPLLFVGLAVHRALPGAGGGLVLAAARVAMLTAVSFGLSALVAWLVFGTGVAFAAVAVILGASAYVALAAATQPELRRVLRGVRVRRSRTAV